VSAQSRGAAGVNPGYLFASSPSSQWVKRAAPCGQVWMRRCSGRSCRRRPAGTCCPTPHRRRAPWPCPMTRRDGAGDLGGAVEVGQVRGRQRCGADRRGARGDVVLRRPPGAAPAAAAGNRSSRLHRRGHVVAADRSRRLGPAHGDGGHRDPARRGDQRTRPSRCPATSSPTCCCGRSRRPAACRWFRSGAGESAAWCPREEQVHPEEAAGQMPAAAAAESTVACRHRRVGRPRWSRLS
jgi:hypothetical protein